MNRRLMMVAVTIAFLCGVGLSAKEQGTADGEWPTYGGNLSKRPVFTAGSDHRRELQ